MTLQTILEQFREDARSNRDLGDRFELLIVAYLKTDPIFAERFSDVWLWNDWPEKGAVGDVGIDIVARERATGGCCAVQCKFYLPDHAISKEDIDSFFTAAGRKPFTSCMIVSTTDRWGKNALDALQQDKPVTRLSVHDLEASPIDWSKFDAKSPMRLARREKKAVRPHQHEALADVKKGFSKAARGKLIMACGTGKTFTSLRLAEEMTPKGHVLFLVPSLSLLSQSLREWTAEAQSPIQSLAVCSDTKVGKTVSKGEDDNSDITLYDLAFPATTSARQLVAQYNGMKAKAKGTKAPAQMTVVFSTYHSIATVSEAQKNGFPEFDLIICDEAHRTTGVTIAGADESHFVKVHDAKFLKGEKRLYMTATPRIYSDDAKGKAKEASAELCSMDDTAIFGEEFHRLGFGEAVGKNLLSDYKVLVLAVDEKYVAKTFQRQISKNGELNLDDAVKITGCWNGLSKKFESNIVAGTELQGDIAPMRRAVAFSRSIKDSRAFVQKFGQIITAYREAHPDSDGHLSVEADHVDGTFDALKRDALLDWLKANPPENTCRVLSNARCLSEGVDVPALDAVLFLNPRNSVIDVVQSVGRVMRKAEGKRYGYIVLPIGIPADMSPEEALKDNEKYKVVWQVLQALRAHDDRFNATINKIELNHTRPANIQVIGVGGGEPAEGAKPGEGQTNLGTFQGLLAFPNLEEWKDAIYGRLVLKCGDRRYWESWAKDVAEIAERHITRIKALLEGKNKKQARAFEEFLGGLQVNLNPAVTREDAIEMLSQHLITRPVFDALFQSYAFSKRNPVSVAMQRMLDALEDEALGKETFALEKFYASVRSRVEGIDNAEGRQKVVVELYDKFFRAAFPRMAERLGIVYTPVEVVDFIIKSVEVALKKEFSSGLADEHVHVIDPFTGTGTFIVRLLQSGLVAEKDLLRKYQKELHANEIVLLAYYIAAINIEETFHGLRKDEGKREYVPFEGIVLTDTFQLYEPRGEIIEMTFPENNQRVRRQKASPIRVIIANPPYSALQNSENDGNKNLKYPHLDERIRNTYAARSGATLLNSVYDSYVRAIRWATDRLSERGVIGFVTNGSYIDANALDGLRACLTEEFSSIYVFNLRGNQRTAGEISRQEGGKIFGSGSRTPVAITLLIKNPAKAGKCELHYHDIGDYLSREDKLSVIQRFESIGGIEAAEKWVRVTPNAKHDWINQRDEAFGKFTALGKTDDGDGQAYFEDYSSGVKTNRDAWCYNFARSQVESHMKRMIAFYNEEVRRFQGIAKALSAPERAARVESFVNTDSRRIHWTREIKEDLARGKQGDFSKANIRLSMYRPFAKQYLYFDRQFNNCVYQLPQVFPRGDTPNMAIMVSGPGAARDFSALMVDCTPNLHLLDTGQCFPLYWYEPADKSGELKFDEPDVVDGYRRVVAITNPILRDFQSAYGTKVGKEDIFYYVYGVLNSPDYRRRFGVDLRKLLPRVPLTRSVTDFKAFCQAGRDLAKLHLNYESVEPFALDERSDQLALERGKHFEVQKMTFGRKDKAIDKTTVVYNSHITLRGIPLEAYEYVVNGKSAIEWIMDRYQVTRDPASGIPNDPNDWSKDAKQPRYILDLLKRIITVSLATRKICKALPDLNAR